jgi:hypothetical protein
MFVVRTDVRKPPGHISMNQDTLSFQWDNIINGTSSTKEKQNMSAWTHYNCDNVNHTMYDGDFTNMMTVTCTVVS